jgi:hypothetical protein
VVLVGIGSDLRTADSGVVVVSAVLSDVFAQAVKMVTKQAATRSFNFILVMPIKVWR